MFEDHYFSEWPEQFDFYKSRYVCQTNFSWPGTQDLASIVSKEENDFFDVYMLGEISDYWIGAKSLSYSNVFGYTNWTWLDGEQFGYSNFEFEEVQQYEQLVRSYNWYSENASRALQFICKMACYNASHTNVVAISELGGHILGGGLQPPLWDDASYSAFFEDFNTYVQSLTWEAVLDLSLQ